MSIGRQSLVAESVASSLSYLWLGLCSKPVGWARQLWSDARGWQLGVSLGMAVPVYNLGLVVHLLITRLQKKILHLDANTFRLVILNTF